VAALPIELDRDDITDRRRTTLRSFELVDDVAARLAGRMDGPGSAIGGAQKRSAIRRLATAPGIEDRSIEKDDRPLAAVVDGQDSCLRRASVGLRVTELPGYVHVRAAYLTVRTPFIVPG
jgi:hypothetical protein